MLRDLWNSVTEATQTHGVLSHIPKPARLQFCSLLTSAIVDFVTLQTEMALLKLLLLPRLVLHSFRRGGNKNSKRKFIDLIGENRHVEGGSDL